MEIYPGVGVADVRIGDVRADIEARLGPPTTERSGRVFYDDLDPALVVGYDSSGLVEDVEIPYSGSAGREVTLGEIQLTYRPMEDVLHDLEVAGHAWKRSDIGYDFEDGFAIWSMSSLEWSDIDPSGSPDDDRPIVEGVYVAKPATLGF